MNILTEKRLVRTLVLSLLSTGLMGCYLHAPAPSDQTSPAVGRMVASLAPRSIAPAKKIVALPAPKLVRNKEVTRELNVYKKGGRTGVLKSHKRRLEFESMMREVFRDEGVPLELLNVGLVESHYKAHARSHAGAVGIWQFIKSTARVYGLKVNGKEDQRKDPVLSTIAAARHLRDLYEQFENWELALAAYNAGPGRVRGAMRRGGTTDYWALCRKKLLPRETRLYVPRIYAAAIIDKAPLQNGFVELASLKKRKQRV